MNETSYPLVWPTGKPRTARPEKSHFGQSSYAKPSIEKARQFLSRELDLLRAKNPILSTNQELRLDGQPRSDRRPVEDPGCAVYFTLNGKRIALSCDAWNALGCNIWAIAKHIEALRGQDRWGVGSIDQAFAGYAALPAPSNPADNCWTILQLDPQQATREKVDVNYRILAHERHPDRGGSHEAMAQLNEARAAALAQLNRS